MTVRQDGLTGLDRPTTALDVLRLPLLGDLLKWRWGRLVFQLLILVLAGLILYDGFTGPQLAPANSATVLSWVHYRGLVILALLLVGNVFCFACPFTLPRTLARRLSIAGGRWPPALRNKWVSIGMLFLLFLLYEWLDLWASPWLTAWIAVAYFVGSFLLETLFSESAFCMYVCPLGAFNFVYSTLSPLQITARDLDTCRNCEGKECVNGSDEVLGCGTELFVPTMASNMNCTFCLDCARACPYDNVALETRPPWKEILSRLPRRWDLSFLLVSLTFFGFFNAFGMVPPVYRLQRWLAETAGLNPELLQLALILGLGTVALPGLILWAGSWLSRRAAAHSGPRPLIDYASNYAPAFVPMGMGIWLAHYGFHFVIGGLTIVPVLQSFLLDHGLAWLGVEPRWDLGFLLPTEVIFPLQIAAVLLGFMISLASLGYKGMTSDESPTISLRQILPWALVLAALAVASLAVFGLPMEMRGAVGG